MPDVITSQALKLLADLLAERGVVPEGLDAEQAATFCGVSRSKWYAMEHEVPMPVDVGGCRRWLRSELAAWMRAGCPSRPTWRAIRETQMRRSA